MRLHLTIQRHGLPVTRILWTTSPPSLYGHSLPSPASMIPAAASAITSSRIPNALYANGGYTIAQLLEDVNEVIPLETEPRLFEDESSGQWGLEDYVVEVGGSECLHFMEVNDLLRDGDEVLIRALQISDLRARRLSGRHQISADGKHLIDGVPFGKPFLKRPTSSRPAITIPPRKKRRTALAVWGSGNSYEEEDTEWAPHISTGKELSVLKPESELRDESEDEFKSAYQDDYEDYHEPNEQGDETVIRHNIDRAEKESESDEEISDFEPGDLTQELQDLKKDMDVPAMPELEKAEEEEAAPRGYSLRSRPSTQQRLPRKSSLWRRSNKRPSDTDSRRDSKAVRFDGQKQEPSQEQPVAKLVAPDARAGSTSEEPEDSVSSGSASSTSVSESDSSDSDSSSSDKSSSASGSASESASDSSSESEDDDSPSESSEPESESEQEEVPKADNALQPARRVNPPGAGSLRTKKSNQRTKLRRKLAKLKELGILDSDADFAALRKWEEETGGSFYIPETATDTKTREQEEFEAKRQKLLRDLESGGIDVSATSEKENISPSSDKHGTSEQPEDHDEHYETANDTNDASPEVPHRRTLDVASTRRLLFGSLGVRAPRSKEEEEATRKKLAGNVQKPVPQPKVQDAAENDESEPEVDWREKLTLAATECVYDDVELSAPPFPFEQHWDAEAGDIIRQRKGWGKKRKRRQQLQVYDANGDDSHVDDGSQLIYDEAEQPEAEANQEEESGQPAAKAARGAEDDLPSLPTDTSGLPDLAAGDMKPGLVFAFKQLDVSKATNWQPTVSDYRVAVVRDVFGDNIFGIQLAKPYRRQPKDDAECPFQYSGFEMPGLDDEEGDDDGFREVPFDDLIEPKQLRAAPAADTENEDNASNFSAAEELPAREPSQSAVDAPATSGGNKDDQQITEESCEGPMSLNDEPLPIMNTMDNDSSPVRSPRFDGFEYPKAEPIPVSRGSPSSAASSAAQHRDEEQRRPSPSTGKESPCRDALQQGSPEPVSTDQLQLISSPGSVQSYHRLMNFLLSQNPSSPATNEKKSSPVSPASQGSASPMVPNPFYEIDKAYEERRQSSRSRAQRDRSYDGATSRELSPKLEVPSSVPRKSSKLGRRSPTSAKEPSQVSMVPDSVRPDAQHQYERTVSPLLDSSMDFIDLTQSSPPVSPSGSDEDNAKTHRLPRGSDWVQKNVPSTRRQTRQSSTSTRGIRTLEDMSISPPRRRRGRQSKG